MGIFRIPASAGRYHLFGYCRERHPGIDANRGGKSITFQVPALAREGICIVITPLIALMKDQVENLQGRGIKAMAVHSGMRREEISIALDNCVFGDFKFLYVSPERIGSELFRVRVQDMNVNLLAIDEAHCISQWGYDFRPAYLKIPKLRELLPEVPVLALTATATPEVTIDIQERLDFKAKNLLKTSFERKNLVYLLRTAESKEKELLALIKESSGSGIVYVRNRRKCRELAELLSGNGIRSDYYHAGLKHDVRSRKQEEWTRGKIRVIVATNAFGMGIDKPDVRFVVHVDLPDNPEAYFQEAGRAGRDGKESAATLIYSQADERMARQRISVNFPGIPKVKEIYNALGNFLQVPVGGGKGQSYDFDFGGFLTRFRLNALVAHSSLDVLMREGYIIVSEEINNPSRIYFKVSRDELYRFQVKNEKFDSFIKLLLRSYTGMFSQFVNINEGTLAKRSGLSMENIYVYLKNLAKVNIISYVPQKQNPVITYLEERLDEPSLLISPKHYNFRRERYVSRMEEMLRYAKSTKICRSQFLLSYFGELNSPRCGKCDVCRADTGETLDSVEFEQVRNKIELMLKESAMAVETLIAQSGIETEKVLWVIDWLIDQNMVTRDEEFNLLWRQKE